MVVQSERTGVGRFRLIIRCDSRYSIVRLDDSPLVCRDGGLDWDGSKDGVRYQDVMQQ